MTSFEPGFPSVEAYRNLFENQNFARLEEFSNQFLKINNATLKNYKKKWVKDPLHQWSRQWEYPFTLEHLLPILKSQRPEIHILDAGSGITFFPFYLKSISPESVAIHCSDYDESLSDTFKSINASEPHKVVFEHADIHKLPYPDNFFDAIYCISVLEHTRNYQEILMEFKRCLKSEGRLILTFDISIDGTADISIEKAEELMEEISSHFKMQGGSKSIRKQLQIANPFTTFEAKKIDPNLLPWKTSLISRLKDSFKGETGGQAPLLTFYCQTFIKD